MKLYILEALGDEGEMSVLGVFSSTENALVHLQEDVCHVIIEVLLDEAL